MDTNEHKEEDIVMDGAEEESELTQLEQETVEFLSKLVLLRGEIKGYRYAGYEELVLREGCSFEVRERPAELEKREFKNCFENAYKVCVEHGYHYAEGYALGLGGLPLHHAWNLDEEGRAVDTTWDDGQVYIGIPFTREELMTVVAAKGTYGILDDYANLHPLLKDVFSKERLLEVYEGILGGETW